MGQLHHYSTPCISNLKLSLSSGPGRAELSHSSLSQEAMEGRKGRVNAINVLIACTFAPASPQGLRLGWGRRVRRSLGLGCHYLGLGVLSITNYIPEAFFMGPMMPRKNYDGEYIYTSSDYVVPEYM